MYQGHCLTLYINSSFRRLIHEFIYYSEFLICNHSFIYVFIYGIGQIKYLYLRIYLIVFISTQVAYRYRIKAHSSTGYKCDNNEIVLAGLKAETGRVHYVQCWGDCIQSPEESKHVDARWRASFAGTRTQQLTPSLTMVWARAAFTLFTGGEDEQLASVVAAKWIISLPYETPTSFFTVQDTLRRI